MRNPLKMLRDERGTATVEFALTMPVALFLSLVLVQLTLLMGGHIYVHYAAFAAARSAITTIPLAAGEEEPSNVYVGQTTVGKHERIRRAAVFAVMPVSGRSASDGSSNISAEAFAQGLRQYYQANNTPTPRWVDTFAAARLRYADEHTRVEVCTTQTGKDGSVTILPIAAGVAHQFSPNDAVTVRVLHRFHLSVPYVRQIFADEDLPDGSGVYTLISAQSTLSNEGIAKNLPPKPAIRRDP